jgi:hypothetical protein
MAVDPSLVPVAPHEPERVISNRLNIGQFEVATVHKLNGTLVTLTMCAGTKAPEQFVRIRAAMPIRPVDLHHAGTARRAELARFWSVTQEGLPSHRPDAAPVRARTLTVA